MNNLTWQQKLALAYGKNPQEIKVLNKTHDKTRTTGRHALRPYLGIVEFPISRGGGTVWIKSAVALRKYQDLNYKVVWL